MRLLYALGVLAFVASFFLPAVKSRETAWAIGTATNWAEDVEREFSRWVPELGKDSAKGSVKIGDETFGLGRPRSLHSDQFPGYEAARLVFEESWKTLRSSKPLARKATSLWIILANPLFVIAFLVGILGLHRPAALFHLLGAGSAAYWLYGADFPTSELGLGYWLWLASFPLAAVGAAARSK